MSASARATTQELLVAMLRTPLGGLVARPWFDRVALRTIAYWFFPLSRLWASARVAHGSAERFFEAAEIAATPRLTSLVERRLARFEAARAEVDAIEQEWEETLFGAAVPAAATADATEAKRLAHRSAYNGLRRIFIPVRLACEVAPVHWQIPTPDAVGEIYGPLVADPQRTFAPPNPMPEITVSHAVHNRSGARSYWLRFASPAARRP
jgi:hypothetical protein